MDALGLRRGMTFATDRVSSSLMKSLASVRQSGDGRGDVICEM